MIQRIKQLSLEIHNRIFNYFFLARDNIHTFADSVIWFYLLICSLVFMNWITIPITLYFCITLVFAVLSRDSFNKTIKDRVKKVEKTTNFLSDTLDEMYNSNYILESEEKANSYVKEIQFHTKKLHTIYVNELVPSVTSQDNSFENCYTDYKNKITHILSLKKELEISTDLFKNQ